MSRQRIGAFWAQQYKETRKIPYPGHRKHEWIELERVARFYGEPLVRWCIWRFLRGYEDDKWVAQSQGWSLFAFSSRLPALMIEARERRNERRKAGFARQIEALPELDKVVSQATFEFTGPRTPLPKKRGLDGS